MLKHSGNLRMVALTCCWEQRALSGLSASTSMQSSQLQGSYAVSVRQSSRRKFRGIQSSYTCLASPCCIYELLHAGCHCFTTKHQLLHADLTGCIAEHSQQPFWQPRRRTRSSRMQHECLVNAQQMLANGVSTVPDAVEESESSE